MQYEASALLNEAFDIFPATHIWGQLLHASPDTAAQICGRLHCFRWLCRGFLKILRKAITEGTCTQHGVNLGAFTRHFDGLVDVTTVLLDGAGTAAFADHFAAPRVECADVAEGAFWLS
jgi:hypothetical protein